MLNRVIDGAFAAGNSAEMAESVKQMSRQVQRLKI